MHSLLRHTVLGVSLTLSAFAFAQNSNQAAPAAATVSVPVAQTTPASPAAPATPASPAAQPAAPQTAAPATAPATASAANDAKPSPAGPIGAPPAGKGQVIFFRDSKFVGAMLSFMVREGTTELGKLSNGSYFVAVVDPGTHIYTVHSEAKDNLTLEVEAGENYYVGSSITMGFMAGRPHLTPSDEATFDPLQPKLTLNK
jgi:hypothetical protein